MPNLNQLLSQSQHDETSLLEILSGVCHGSVAIDAAGAIVWISKRYCQLMGLPDTDLIGKAIDQVIPSSQMPRVLQTGEPIFADLMDINDHWCLVTRLPLKNSDGEVIGALGFVFHQDLDSLQPLFTKFSRLRQTLEHNKLLRPTRYALSDLLGESAPMQQLQRQAMRAAQLDTTLLLLGETGTGKELLAQGIHQASPRREGPFVGINMGALPESLAEAELFGSAPGAYTGADRKGRKGKILLADGGTLFLDEIAEMPLAMQSKLLRVLQEREVEALGSDRLVSVDIRVIAATAKDLKAQVDAGRFRADLYYRLNVLPLNLPPLRQRGNDILLLSQHLLQQIQASSGLPVVPLSESARQWLLQYPWPGNVRELRNRLERACVMADGSEISAADLGAGDDLPAAQPNPPAPSLQASRQQAERDALQQALSQCAGNKSAAARLLGISRTSFYQQLKRAGL